MRLACFVSLLALGCSGTQFSDLFEGGASDDAGTEASSEGGGNGNKVPPVQVTCGPQLQCTSAQTCCIGQANGNPTYTCSNGACPVGQAMLACTKAADCPTNNVCCAHVQNNQATSACMASCPQGFAQLCDPKAMPTGCPMGTTCSNNNIGDFKLPESLAMCRN